MCVGRKLLFNLASDRVDRGEHPVSSKMIPHPPNHRSPDRVAVRRPARRLAEWPEAMLRRASGAGLTHLYDVWSGHGSGGPSSRRENDRVSSRRLEFGTLASGMRDR
jgi:hypothetical protein